MECNHKLEPAGKIIEAAAKKRIGVSRSKSVRGVPELGDSAPNDICAESYKHLACAKILAKHGADINFEAY